MRLTKRVLLLTIAAAGFAAAQDVDPPGRVGRLNYLSGSVSFQPAGVDDWVSADPNRPLTTGDHLWVERDARAELQIGGAALRLGPQTLIQFLNLDDRAAQIRVSEGTLVVRVRVLDQDQSFEVDTPNLAFSILRPGQYRIDANPDNETTSITVRSGDGEVTGGGQAFSVHPDQMARVTGNDTITYDVGASQAPDYFEEWAMSRDRLEDRSVSARYVSPEMIGYQDLDSQGVWREEPEYGAIWVPRSVPAGWAPYRFGHWAWIEPWGWTWVDDASWGFAPFHYGRWAFIGGSWGWVPGPRVVRPVYAPALVAWVGGAHFNLALSVGGGAGVAWFPLGPREVYVPAYRASRGYITRVNTTNTIVNNINVTNVTNVRYINQSAPGAVTAVSRETFVNARPVGRSAFAVNPAALQNAQVVRTAAVAPSRESVLGRPFAGSAPRPPESVLNRPVVARTPPPPAPVPFAQRRQALEANPGQPLDPASLSRMRQSQPNVRPLVRQAPDVPAATGAGGGRGFRQQPVYPNQQPNAAPANPPVYTDRNRYNTPAQPVRPAAPAVTPQPNADRELQRQQIQQERRQQRQIERPQERPAAPVVTPQPNLDRELQRQQIQQERRQERQIERPQERPAQRPEVQAAPRPSDGGRRSSEQAKPERTEHKEAPKPDKKDDERRKP